MRTVRAAALAAVMMAPAAHGQEAYPPAFLQTLLDANVARMIAEVCPTLAFSDAAEAQAVRDLTARLGGEGIAAADVQRYLDNPPMAWLQTRLTDYAVERGFPQDVARAGCAAGRRELAARSGVAGYLERR